MSADEGGGKEGLPPPQARLTRTLMRKRPLWRRVFQDNLGMKVVALVIGVALFFVVREDKGKEVDIDVPVVLSNLAETAVFTGEIPRSLRVRVRDRWSRLARALERKTGPYLVDLRGFADSSTFVFDRDRVRQLLGVSSASVQSIYPSDFIVRLDPKVEKAVTIRPTFVGDPQEGFDLPRDRIKVQPSHVKVWGARSSVKEVAELATYPIDLSTLDKDARIEIQIQKPNLPFLFMDEDKIQVDVQVRARQGKVQLDDVDVIVKNCPEGLECDVEPSKVDVSLVGALPTLLKVKKKLITVEVYVDAGDFDAQVVHHDGVRPACDRPGGIDCTMGPKAVNLTIFDPSAPDKGRAGHKTK